MQKRTPSKSEICAMYPDFPAYRIRKIVNEILIDAHNEQTAKYRKVLTVKEFELVKEELGEPPIN